MDKSEETVSEFIITGSDAAKLFQLQKESFYQMPFLIKPPIHIPRIGFIALGRNTEISIMIGYVFTQFPLAISFVGQHRHTGPQFDSFQHFLSDFHIMHVSC